MSKQEYLTVGESCASLPHRPHHNSARRWMHEGCHGIKLRSIKFGGKRLTTKAWIDEFVEAVTSRLAVPVAHHEAEGKLDKLGVRSVGAKRSSPDKNRQV